MGQFPLRQKKQSGIGTATFAVQPERHYFPRESENRSISSLSLWAAKRRAVSRATCDDTSVNARLDIISDYARKCGERHWAGALRTSSRGDLAGSRAGREYIRRPYGADGITVADADGAKEIDCYV